MYRLRPMSFLLFLFTAVLFSGQVDAQSPPRVAIAGISHESNSFNPDKTRLSDFIKRERSSIPETLELWSRSNDTVSGFIEEGLKQGLELYPALLASATPKGPVTDHAFVSLMEEMLQLLKRAPRLDGVYLSLHGAMVVESYPHGDAEIVRRVRELFGSDFPIVVTHDFHANVSAEIVEHATALITYKENPHLDTKERGKQAAEIMAAAVAGEVKPVMALVKPPMLYNILYQNTFAQPLAPIVAESRKLEQQNPKILGVSVSGGYQYADVPAMGPSVIVITDNDPELARREAQRLSDMLWATRDRLVLNLPDAAEAVRLAMASDKSPVVLVDMGDNIGGGSAGDSTFLLEQLVRQKARGWVMSIADPEAVQVAARSGVGGDFDFETGGKTDQFHGRPVRIRGRVKLLNDGKYFEPEVRHGGEQYFDQGLTAVIEVEGSTRDLPSLLMLTSERQNPNSLHQLISNGIYPERQRILVVKAAIAYRAAYEPVAGRIIEVDTPGLTAVNPDRFTFKNIKRPMYGVN